MRNFLYGLAIGIAVIAPASASSFGGMSPNATPMVLAGEVNDYGVPVAGSGFTSRRISRGNYEIEFENGRMRGCDAMVASAENEYEIATPTQVGCGRKFFVVIGNATGGLEDSGFHFVAVQE